MDKIIGQNLCKLRKANSFTQEQVAEYLGINRSTYSNYELGEREMPFDLLERIADLLGCDLTVLMEEDEAVVNEMMVCSFRVDDLSADDLEQIAAFKRIVKNYVKMNELLQL
ncbi:MAG: helix-turn-helix transcriptional regulator [Bacteroidaceae bacterium]|nr:helix-turn-helix transcriptional regulator [Bacteroidaceae bacterium]